MAKAFISRAIVLRSFGGFVAAVEVCAIVARLRGAVCRARVVSDTSSTYVACCYFDAKHLSVQQCCQWFVEVLGVSEAPQLAHKDTCEAGGMEDTLMEWMVGRWSNKKVPGALPAMTELTISGNPRFG